MKTQAMWVKERGTDQISVFSYKRDLLHGAEHGNSGADPYFFVLKTSSRHVAPRSGINLPG